MTPEQYRALVKKPRPKYGNHKVVVDGYAFDSKKESRRYGELLLLQQQGAIEDLELQPRYPIEIGGVKVCVVVPDFKYRCRVTGDVFVEDVKSPATRRNSTYRLKNRLLKAVYGIEIVEV